MAATARPLSLLSHLRRHIGAIADQAVAAVTDRWTAARQRLEPEWQSAATAASTVHGGRLPSPWQLARIPRVTTAVLRTEQELGPLTAATTRRIGQAITDAATATLELHPHILAAAVPGVTTTDAARGIARVDALRRQQIDRLAAEGRMWPAEVAAAVRRGLTRPARGTGPPEMTAAINAVFAVGQARAATTAATHTLDAYRTAASALDLEAGAAVAGWVWISALDRRECPACWAMHGTRHPLRQPGPLGHPNCRCVRAPLSRGPGGLAVSDLPDAATAFAGLHRTDQVRIMSAGRLQLLNDGDITWPDLAVLTSRAGHRSSYSPRSLGDLNRIARRRQPRSA